MHLRLADEKEAGIWNGIVEKDPQSNFFDKYEWCQSLGQVSGRVKPLPMFLEGEDGNIEGVFPSCLMKYKFSIGLESLPFSDYGGGPIFRRNDVLEHHYFYHGFFENLIDFASGNGCLKISIRRAYYPDLLNGDVVDVPFTVDTNNCSFSISLDQGIDQIYRKIDDGRRRSIRRGEKKGTTVREARNFEDLLNVYEIYVETMNRLKSKPLPFKLFTYVWDVFVPKNEVKMFISEYNDKPIGSIVLFNYKGICHAWSGGSLYEYRDKSPMDLLIWHSIKWASESDLRMFDLGSTENDVSSGHYYHKKTWGGEKKVLYNYHIAIHPRKLRFYSICNDVYNKIKNIRYH